MTHAAHQQGMQSGAGGRPSDGASACSPLLGDVLLPPEQHPVLLLHVCKRVAHFNIEPNPMPSKSKIPSRFSGSLRRLTDVPEEVPDGHVLGHGRSGEHGGARGRAAERRRLEKPVHVCSGKNTVFSKVQHQSNIPVVQIKLSRSSRRKAHSINVLLPPALCKTVSDREAAHTGTAGVFHCEGDASRP